MIGTLLVKDGSKKRAKPFRPRLVIGPGTYPRQWKMAMFKPGLFIGSVSATDRGLSEMFAHYMSELKRTGHIAC